MRVGYLLPGVVLLAVAACGGGGSPAAPAPVPSPTPALAAGSVLTFVAGDTGKPVADVEVTVRDAHYRSDSSGQLVVAADTSIGALIDAVHPAYLARQTSLRAVTGTTFSLWPIFPDYDQTYIQVLVYVQYYNPVQSPSMVPNSPLRRFVAQHVSVVPSADIQANPRAMEAHQRAIDEINDAMAGLVTMTLDREPVGTVIVRSTLDPSITGGGIALPAVNRRGEITGGEIRLHPSDTSPAQEEPRVVTHELGHILGLNHSIRAGDVMWFSCCGTIGSPGSTPYSFTATERLTLHLMHQRLPGTVAADNDRMASASAFRRAPVFVCPYR